MTRLPAVMFFVGALWMLGSGAALAAKPNHQACLGEDFSGYARAFPPFGHLLITFEHDDGTPIIDGGLGAEIQAHLAGDVPDSTITNACND